MKYNTPYITRTLWKNVQRNEFNIKNLKKWVIRRYSLTYQKNVYFYQTEWDSWLNIPCPTIASFETSTSIPSQAFMIMVKLEWFPENKIPFIEANLIAKTIAGGETQEPLIGEPNSDYVDKFGTLIVDGSNWYYSYIIKREEETEGAYAQVYKARHDKYPPSYYLISYVSLEFKEGANNLPLEFKQLITINLPKYDFVRADKQ